MRTSTTRTFAALGAAAMLLAACGDSDDTVTETPEVEETEAATDAPAEETEAADEEAAAPSVAFASPADGDTVAAPVEVTFTAEGVVVAPAGEIVEGEGHFHVMIDVPCIAAGEVIPNDESHLHFGDGSMSATLDLEAGEHTLCLQLADGAHTALDLTHEITITVA